MKRKPRKVYYTDNEWELVETLASEHGYSAQGEYIQGMQTKHFSALCRYVAKPEEKDEDERVAWLESRNLPGLDGHDLDEADAIKAAFWMGATAALNRNTSKRAAIHYVINFSPKDTPRLHNLMLKDIANRCLDVINTREHQALIACHIDRDHTHLHITLNRIHPVTEKPVNSFQDMVELERLMREVENQYHLEPVQGRHFDLDGNPLSPNAPRPRRRPTRAGELKRLREQLGDKNPFQKSRNWDELFQMGRDKGVGIVNAGTRLELRTRENSTSISAGDLFKDDAHLDSLERKFGESYQAWDINRIEAVRAIKLGITLNALRALDEERRIKKKAAARRRMLRQQREHETILRKITKRPIRIANNPDLFPECTDIYGPAINDSQAREVLNVLQSDEAKEWLKRTKFAIEQLGKSIEDKSKDRNAWVQDDKDAQK